MADLSIVKTEAAPSIVKSEPAQPMTYDSPADDPKFRTEHGAVDRPKGAAPERPAGVPHRGTFLPLYYETDPKTGKPIPGSQDWAVPGVLRDPLVGAIQWGRRLRGEADPYDPMLTPEMVGAVPAFGGAPGLSGGAKAVAAGVRTPAQLARDSGYVLTPAMADNPNRIEHMAAGLSGKIKLQQSASVKNQEVTNRLGAEALGLAPETQLTDKVFNKVREDAGKAYEAVTKAVPEVEADQVFKDQISNITHERNQAAAHFPTLMSNPEITTLVKELSGATKFPSRVGIDVVKDLRFNANQNLKAIGNPQKHALGLAQRTAADALDSLIARRIQERAGAGEVDPRTFANYRDARRTIAMSYDLEGATNSATGDVSAQGLAKLANRGRPLSGNLETIATVANAFPKAVQNPERFGGEEPYSGFDFFGSAAGVVSGHPAATGFFLGRPLARSILLSKPVQNRMTPAVTMPETQSMPLAPVIVPATIEDLLRRTQ